MTRGTTQSEQTLHMCHSWGPPASVTYGVCFKSCYCSCFCYVIADTLRDNELEGCIHRLHQEVHRCSPDPQAAELILIKVSFEKPVAFVWTYKIVCAEDTVSRLLRSIGTHPPDYTASHSIPYFCCCLHCENQGPYANNYVIFSTFMESCIARCVFYISNEM
jgi:hypothetical protein